jgi:hypothetical protein
MQRRWLAGWLEERSAGSELMCLFAFVRYPYNIILRNNNAFGMKLSDQIWQS